MKQQHLRMDDYYLKVDYLTVLSYDKDEADFTKREAAKRIGSVKDA